MTEKMNEVFNYMIDNGYIVKINEVYKLTNKFNRDYDDERVINTVSSTSLIRGTGVKKKSSEESAELSEQLYRKFVEDVDIPFRLPTGDGKEYTIRTYGKEAIKKLVSILKTGINYHTLVFATKCYYANSKLYRKTLTNYLVDDVWRAYYDEAEIISSSEEGIKSHVKNITDSTSGFGKDI